MKKENMQSEFQKVMIEGAVELSEYLLDNPRSAMEEDSVVLSRYLLSNPPPTFEEALANVKALRELPKPSDNF